MGIYSHFVETDTEIQVKDDYLLEWGLEWVPVGSSKFEILIISLA